MEKTVLLQKGLTIDPEENDEPASSYGTVTHQSSYFVALSSPNSASG